MTRAEKDFLELKIKDVVRETVDEVIDKLPCADMDKRIRKNEQKLNNGINIRINILYGFYVLLLAGIIKLAFF